MITNRDYNQEWKDTSNHKYIYDFDDAMTMMIMMNMPNIIMIVSDGGDG